MKAGVVVLALVVALGACRGAAVPRPPAPLCEAAVELVRAARDEADTVPRRVLFAVVLALLETACATPATDEADA